VAGALVPRLPLGPLVLDVGNVSVLCGLGSVVGHVFPVYVGFRGGKGVATATGMLLATAPLPMACAVGIFLTALVLSGFVSLGSILAAASIPVLIAVFNRYHVGDYPPLLLWLTAALLPFTLFTHRKNIVRLARGTELTFSGLPPWRKRSPK